MYLIFPNRLMPHLSRVEDHLGTYTPKINIVRCVPPDTHDNLTVGERLSLLSADLIDRLIHNDNFIQSETQNAMTLTVFNPVNIDKIDNDLINRMPSDAVCFDNIDYKLNKNWMLCSVQTFLKLTISSSKLLKPAKFIESNLYFSEPHGVYFEFMWFAQRIGLRVYEP